jgi:tRNA pseudouridine55 synthase
LRECSGTLPSFSEVREAAQSFAGVYLQTPPMYSALKVNGKKLVDLARGGITVEREAREVSIYSIDAAEEGGAIYLSVHCSRGTYIRTLCADIGRKLGCGACMGTLERTRVGRFCLSDSVTLEWLHGASQDEIDSKLVTVEDALSEFPKFSLSHFHSGLITNGCAVDVKKLRLGEELFGQNLRLYDGEVFFGVGRAEMCGDIYALRQKKLFLPNPASTK